MWEHEDAVDEGTCCVRAIHTEGVDHEPECGGW